MPTGPNQTATTRRISKTFDLELELAPAASATSSAANFPVVGIDVGGGRHRGIVIVDIDTIPDPSTLFEVNIDNTSAMASPETIASKLAVTTGRFSIAFDFSSDEATADDQNFITLRVTPTGGEVIFSAYITKSDNDRTS